MDLAQKTVFELSELLQKGSCAPEDVLRSVAEAIRTKDGAVHAYVDFDPERYLKRWKKMPKTSSRLWGIPFAVKDNLCVRGEEITCASKILKNFISPYHATVIEKLEEKGAIVFGRTNMDEFAFGSSCETSCYGPTRNPWDLERVPGGSSGGSAAAVANDTAVFALGTDTGGSVRQPASFCGVTGIKPTYSRVSRYGLIAFASSLDQIGPLTKDVRDMALVLEAAAGHDPRDSTSADVPVPRYSDFLGRDVKGMKIGIPKEYFQKGLHGLHGDVEEAILKAVKVLEGLGISVEEVSLPLTHYAINVYYIVAPSEASSNLARFDGVRFGRRSEVPSGMLDMYERTRGEGFGAEAKRRIILGTFSLSSGYYDAYYLKAMKVRTKIMQDFNAAFQKVDALITPTSPTAAFKLGEKMNDPLEMYLSDIYTISANLAAIPALSVPCGFSNEGLPIGLQFLGKHFDEAALLNLAYAFEQSTDFHRRTP
ncbi:MAG: Asp-tRNA(Asn)/Glu-tRNA(Gln) amidotransferase subunit GatA [Candidatus Omnitrophica bacterium]|nr:Asp-tRNA(Asn)/Glu-tRNA(Gln) amidotransferase subunit GatA [Candidatus Omnitrophota bacterium]